MLNNSAASAERSRDFAGAGYSRGQPLQLEKGLTIAGRDGAVLREGTRGLERLLQAAQVVNAKPMLLLAEQKELEKSRAQDQGR